MGKQMLDYVYEQPGVLKDISEKRILLTQPFVDLYKVIKPDRIYLIASGTSYNAAYAAEHFMEEVLQCEVSVYSPSSVPVIHSRRPMMIFLSQGGNSTNTIAAIEAQEGIPVLALTGTEKCRINEICSHVLIACGEEAAGPKTKGYTAAILTLYYMALETAKKEGIKSKIMYEEAIQECERAIFHLEENIKSAELWYTDNEETLLKMKKCFIVGKDEGLIVAKESALKLLETLLIPVEGFEFEEFLHGPSMAIDKNMAGIYLMPPKEDKDYERMKRLVGFHKEICPITYAIGEGRSMDCPLYMGQWYTRVFGWILISQIMGARLGVKKNIEKDGLDMFWKLDKVLNIKYEGRT